MKISLRRRCSPVTSGIFDILVDDIIVAFISRNTKRLVVSRKTCEEQGLGLFIGEQFTGARKVIKRRTRGRRSE